MVVRGVVCEPLPSLWRKLHLVGLVVTSPHFSHRHLPSAGASAYHLAVTSHYAPLGPLIWLVVTSPLLTPLTPIYW